MSSGRQQIKRVKDKSSVVRKQRLCVYGIRIYYVYIYSRKENALISGMVAYFPAVEALENVDVIRKMGT